MRRFSVGFNQRGAASPSPAARYVTQSACWESLPPCLACRQSLPLFDLAERALSTVSPCSPTTQQCIVGRLQAGVERLSRGSTKTSPREVHHRMRMLGAVCTGCDEPDDKGYNLVTELQQGVFPRTLFPNFPLKASLTLYCNFSNKRSNQTFPHQGSIEIDALQYPQVCELPGQWTSLGGRGSNNLKTKQPLYPSNKET